MKTVPLLPPVVTSRPDGPVCVLTDLSSRLEESMPHRRGCLAVTAQIYWSPTIRMADPSQALRKLWHQLSRSTLGMAVTPIPPAGILPGPAAAWWRSPLSTNSPLTEG
jgi:hypothetical protein